jgi:ABC-type transport system substrate-binding protein
MAVQRNAGSSFMAGNERRLSRRAVLRLLVAGSGSSALLTLLAACGATSTPTTTTAAATTSAAASTAATTTTAAATTAAPNTATSATTTTSAAAATGSASGGQPAGTPATTSSAQATTTTSGAAAPRGGQVNTLWGKPTTLNPLFLSAGNDQEASRLIFGSLYKMNDKIEPVPDLAESYTVSDDAKVYTFKLRKGMKFTDGQELTAKDVIFTFERAIDKRSGSRWQGRLLAIAGAQDYSTQKATNVSGLEAPDDYTLKITLAEPDATFLVILCDYSGLGILPEHVLKDVPPDQLQQHEFSRNPNVSAGPFKFVQYATDQYLELARNDTYGGTPTPLDKLFLRILTAEVGLAQLQTGEIDEANLALPDVERASQIPGVTIGRQPGAGLSFFVVNLQKEYLQDKRLRQAMLHAIDRAGILKQVYRGEGEIVNSTIIGPEWMGTPEGLNTYPYDQNKAKQFLKDINWDSSRTLQIMTTATAGQDATMLTIVQQQWKAVGLNTAILQVDNAELSKRYLQQTPDYEIFLNGGGVFRADPNVSAKYFLTANFPPAGANGARYANPAVDKLFAQGTATKDLTERKRIYTDLAKILNDELPFVPLWSPNSVFGARQRLHGFSVPSYVKNDLWNAETWSVTS